jgi:hypothetical protein
MNTARKYNSSKMDNPDESRVREEVQKLLEAQYFAVLSTKGETHPYGTLVGFVATKGMKHIVFATMKDTRKFRNLSADGHVSLLIDSRTNRVEDIKDAQALTALGEVCAIESPSDGEHGPVYLERHPHLSSFLDDPNTVIVSVKVSRYILVSRFQEVFELEMR